MTVWLPNHSRWFATFLQADVVIRGCRYLIRLPYILIGLHSPAEAVENVLRKTSRWARRLPDIALGVVGREGNQRCAGGIYRRGRRSERAASPYLSLISPVWKNVLKTARCIWEWPTTKPFHGTVGIITWRWFRWHLYLTMTKRDVEHDVPELTLDMAVQILRSSFARSTLSEDEAIEIIDYHIERNRTAHDSHRKSWLARHKRLAKNSLL